MSTKRENLFTDFPPITLDEWMDKITTDLKGVPFEKKLVWRTKEGFNVMPFYRREDIADLKTKDTLPGEFPYVRGTKADNSWYVRQDFKVNDVEAYNKKALDFWCRGATSFGFHLPKQFINKESIMTLIKGLDLKQVEVNFSSCRSTVVSLAHAVIEAFRALEIDMDTCVGSIGFDPFKKQMVKGVVTDEWIQISQDLIEAVRPLKNFTCLNVRGVDMSNSGAYIYQELGYALAEGADLIEILTDKCDLSAAEVASRIRFDMGVGSNYFMEIAKFRAARWLWALIVQAQDETATDGPARMLIHAETSKWNKTVYDAYVNLLRTQTEAMSAAIGGVHSLNVLPFDIIFKDSDEFSDRIARNQQLLLKEESHFDKVVDPAGGSYYVEHLTDAIAQEAWKLFLDIEDRGGFVKLADLGEIQQSINASNDARHKAVATRRESLLGTNTYPNFSEMAAEKLSQTDGRYACGCERFRSIQPLNFSRGASDFESLRLRTEHHEHRPKVFMLTIGNLAMRLARSQFSCNFFACAGYEVIDNLGFKTIKEGVDAAMTAKADIIVLCSSDDEYAEYGPQAYDEIGDRVPLVIAGAPACMDDLKAKGIEHFIHVRVNVLETLEQFHHILGIEK